ncbi:MAG: hypothetical protein J7L76_03840 [Spirochaetaceae bacterium]|nr:hypothetical protein [Spirochaetaceae bacterium]
MKKGLFLLILISYSGFSMLPAQQLPPPDPLLPEDYSPEEFPLWAHDLRRYEVVAIGSYPITFFASSLIYDFSVYAANDFNPSYSMGSQRDGNDIGIIIGSAVCVSLVIATVDLIINTSRRKKAEKQTDEQ